MNKPGPLSTAARGWLVKASPVAYHAWEAMRQDMDPERRSRFWQILDYDERAAIRDAYGMDKPGA